MFKEKYKDSINIFIEKEKNKKNKNKEEHIFQYNSTTRKDSKEKCTYKMLVIIRRI